MQDASLDTDPGNSGHLSTRLDSVSVSIPKETGASGSG